MEKESRVKSRLIMEHRHAISNNLLIRMGGEEKELASPLNEAPQGGADHWLPPRAGKERGADLKATSF